MMYSRLIFFLGVILMSSQPAQALSVVTVEQTEYTAVLRSPAQTVNFPLSPDDLQLIADMKAKLVEIKGVGLAAPQVNYAKKIILINIEEEAALLRKDATHAYPMHVLINPRYQGIEEAYKEADFEACFSVSSKAGKVPRYKKIKLDYQDEQGQWHHRVASDFYARVLQHEIDHINGVLILDRLTPDCIQGTLEEMRALWRQELSADKRALYDELVKQQNERKK